MPCYRQVMSSRRRRYTAEQKAEAVRLARDPRFTLVMVARQLGIPLSTIDCWVRAARRAGQTDPGARRRQLLNAAGSRSPTLPKS